MATFMRKLSILIIACAIYTILFHLIAAMMANKAHAAVPAQWADAKYCGPPKRDASGNIVRSSTALRYFRAQNPCPSTGLTQGACPDYQIDHTRPLASCGCDHPTNMSWLKTSIKTCSGTECKDRWERKAYKCKE